jgi:hypothetical protein
VKISYKFLKIQNCNSPLDFGWLFKSWGKTKFPRTLDLILGNLTYSSWSRPHEFAIAKINNATFQINKKQDITRNILIDKMVKYANVMSNNCET